MFHHLCACCTLSASSQAMSTDLLYDHFGLVPLSLVINLPIQDRHFNGILASIPDELGEYIHGNAFCRDALQSPHKLLQHLSGQSNLIPVYSSRKITTQLILPVQVGLKKLY